MNRIQRFKELHQAEKMLLLGNAWDLPSALALERSGFQAIGTTSWGIAQSRGYGDGEQLDFAVHVSIVKSMVSRVNVPVSADIESGYGQDDAAIIANVLRIADAGASGINIEDSPKQQADLRETGLHGDLIAGIRTALDNNGFRDFYINARVDAFVRKLGLTETIDRAKAYVNSGASGIFVPFLKDDEDIRLAAAQISAPLNVMYVDGLANAAELEALGVKRQSFGGTFYRRTFDFLERSAAQISQATTPKEAEK
jgi:2-methylisocitrate lyase-like PEP mutase family enzyme